MVDNFYRKFPKKHVLLYVTNRIIRFRFKDALSNFGPIGAAVSCRALFSSLLLYSLLTADVPPPDDEGEIVFADGTMITISSKDYQTAHNKVRYNVNRIKKWTAKDKILLKCSKSIEIIFTNKRKLLIFSLTLNNHAMPREKSYRYLGLHLDE